MGISKLMGVITGNEELQLGTNPYNDAIFKRIMGPEPAIRDLIVNFQRQLPPSERYIPFYR